MTRLISALTLSLATLLSAGCISGLRCLDQATPNVHIAYAHQVEDVELTNSLTLIKYKVDTICRGKFVTNDYVYVGFSEGTMPKQGLPKQAILVLHLSSWHQTYAEAAQFVSGFDGDAFTIRTYDALQNDARKGILPDTLENRQKIAAISLQELAQTPRQEQISKARAIEIATVMLRADPESKVGETYKFKTNRYPYGWELFCDIINSNGGQNLGGFCLIYVGDDGEIKHIAGGE